MLRGKTTTKDGTARASKEITQTRMIFSWGHKQELCKPPRFGTEFIKPSKDVLRRHRQASPPKMFESAEIREMLSAAGVHTRAWILLGINCAFIQRDLLDLTTDSVDLSNAMIDFPRRKTAVERRSPLWHEIVAALQASQAQRRIPTDELHTARFFVTRQGNVLVRDLQSASRSDPVHNALQKLQNRLGIKRPGRSFGAFRHTFRTVADETCDFPAMLRIMGHSDNTIADQYRERSRDDRLRKVADHVRSWLFGSEGRGSRR